MVAHQPPCSNFFQHTPAVRRCCYVVWLDSELMWVAVADCCLMLKLSSITSLVAVKRLHRCRLVVWHSHSANQINRRLLPPNAGASAPVVCHGRPFHSALTKSKHSIAVVVDPTPGIPAIFHGGPCRGSMDLWESIPQLYQSH
jgi:hypothetical protein